MKGSAEAHRFLIAKRDRLTLSGPIQNKKERNQPSGQHTTRAIIVTSEIHEQIENCKRPLLGAQASIFNHPALKRKLLTGSVVLEGRGSGRYGGRMEKIDKKGLRHSCFTMMSNL